MTSHTGTTKAVPNNAVPSNVSSHAVPSHAVPSNPVTSVVVRRSWAPTDFPTLERLVELEVLSVFDRELALALAELAGEERLEVLLGAAFASAAVQAGDTCADIGRQAARTFTDAEGQVVEGLVLPAKETWLGALADSALVSSAEREAGGATTLRSAGTTAGAGMTTARAGTATEPRPLVLDAHGRLYLARYFDYESRLARALTARAAAVAEPIDEVALATSFARLFPPEDTRGALQRRAAEVFLRQRLTVVSGGPGTGKTYTVSKALVALQEQALATGRAPYRVLLTAPTGKAAQRLGDAVRDNLEKLGVDAAKLGIPTQASTLHRALGYQPSKPTHFRRNARRPLPDDVVVVDEASMVDLALMAKLVDAVRPEARLLLLGDKDQLASVEAGAILADIYAGAGVAGAGLAGAGVAGVGVGAPTRGVGAGLVHLTESRRFGDDGAIAALAKAVNSGDATGALEVLGRGGSVSLRRVEGRRELEGALGPVLLERLGALGEGTPEERLALLERFRVLAAHRRGPFGVEGINAFAAAELGRRERLEPRGIFYDGRPIIVVANDYGVELFNGDAGVLTSAPSAASGAGLGDAPLRAWFRGGKAGTLRDISPARLPQHETAFALSVHKSQGSEFDEIAFVLPERPSRVLTRELVYTAVTRARRRVTIVGSEAVLRHAIQARVERASGLADRLRGTGVDNGD